MSVAVGREDRVLKVTLSSPQTANALSAAMCRGLAEAFAEAKADPGVRAVLLGAVGDFFSIGMAVDEAANESDEAVAVRAGLFAIGRTLGKPIVAAVQGRAISGGMALVANAHVAVAAQGATFGLTEIRVGTWPFLPLEAVAGALGQRRAMELALTGRVFGTPEALGWGLAHYVVPSFELEERAMQLADGLAESSRSAVSRGLGLEYSGDYRGDPDFLEGLKALKEQRRPKWPTLTI